MKLERIKDYLLLESEFIRNQEVLKPKAERETEQRDKVRLFRRVCLWDPLTVTLSQPIRRLKKCAVLL